VTDAIVVESTWAMAIDPSMLATISKSRIASTVLHRFIM